MTTRTNQLTLQDMADILSGVAYRISHLDEMVETRKDWLELHKDIQRLEQLLPMELTNARHPAVIKARIQWWDFGMTSLEQGKDIGVIWILNQELHKIRLGTAFEACKSRFEMYLSVHWNDMLALPPAERIAHDARWRHIADAA